MTAHRGPRSGLLLHGDRVGRYRILTHVADGGMAAVYLAELDGPSAFSKQVALKVIHRHLMEDHAFVRMFVDEARIAAQLHHPNIVQTFDLVHSDDFLAIVMEYASGLPSSSLMPGSARPLDVPVDAALVAYVGAEAAAGLHHAHTLRDGRGRPLSIVHRDVSPTNVHIGYDGRVRIVDFGIARARGRLSTTAHGYVKGTFAYVAPEQFGGAAPTASSDVWSLGVVLWELLAGRRLFHRGNETDTVHLVLTAPIPPIESMRSDLPLALGMAVHRALERDPARRWPTARDLEDRLREILPAKLELVRDPLLAALAPHRDQHAVEVRTLLELQELEARDDVVEIVVDADEAASRPSEPTPMVVADLRVRRRPRRRKLALGTILAHAALIAAVVMASPRWPQTTLRDLRGAAGSRSGDLEAPVKVSPQSPPVTPVPVARIPFEVTTTVTGARVWLDGRSLGPAPVRTLVDRDPGDHLIRVEAEGRVPREHHVTLDAPVQLELDPPLPR